MNNNFQNNQQSSSDKESSSKENPFAAILKGIGAVLVGVAALITASFGPQGITQFISTWGGKEPPSSGQTIQPSGDSKKTEVMNFPEEKTSESSPQTLPLDVNKQDNSNKDKSDTGTYTQVPAVMNKEQVEPIFNEFIAAWNAEDISRLDATLSKTFFSASHDKNRPYYSADYGKFIKEKSNIFNYASRIEVKTLNDANTQYQLKEDGSMVVSYYQIYKAYKDKEIPYYESEGTNYLYFRFEDGKVKIYKEVFHCDSRRELPTQFTQRNFYPQRPLRRF